MAIGCIAALAALLAGIPGGSAAADGPADSAPAVFVVHVTDYQHVPAGEMADVRRLVSAVYMRDGIAAVWAEGSARIAPHDGRLHVDLVLLNSEMTRRQGPGPLDLGRASHTTRRAYVYYPRVDAVSAEQQCDRRLALALVVAHELGHVLLPAYSHAPTGLMRAGIDGPVRSIPPFERAQGATIRALLMPMPQLAR